MTNCGVVNYCAPYYPEEIEVTTYIDTLCSVEGIYTIKYIVYYPTKEDTIITSVKGFKFNTPIQTSVAGSNYIKLGENIVYSSTAPVKLVSHQFNPTDTIKHFVPIKRKKKLIPPFKQVKTINKNSITCYIDTIPLQSYEIDDYRNKCKFIVGKTTDGQYKAIYPYSKTKDIIEFYKPYLGNQTWHSIWEIGEINESVRKGTYEFPIH